LELPTQLIVLCNLGEVLLEAECVKNAYVSTNAHTWIAGFNVYQSRSRDMRTLRYQGGVKAPTKASIADIPTRLGEKRLERRQ